MIDRRRSQLAARNRIKEEDRISRRCAPLASGLHWPLACDRSIGFACRICLCANGTLPPPPPPQNIFHRTQNLTLTIGSFGPLAAFAMINVQVVSISVSVSFAISSILHAQNLRTAHTKSSARFIRTLATLRLFAPSPPPQRAEDTLSFSACFYLLL